MKFSDVPGHENAKRRLRDMMDSGRLPHALLLEGPAGIGKFMLARAATQYLHCTDRHDGDSCGVCPSCLQHQSFNHIDTIFSFPVVKTSSAAPVSEDYIDVWRQFLRDYPFMDTASWLRLLGNENAQPMIYVGESESLKSSLAYTSHGKCPKVVLMWLPERLQEAAANKLLKLIEEPLGDTMFIMVSNNPQAIMPTIYSRLQRISMQRLPDEIVCSRIETRYGLSHEDAMALAHIAEGSMIKAQELAGRNKETAMWLNLFITLMREAYQRHVLQLKEWSADVAALGREKAMAFIDYSARLVRENFIYNLHVPQLNYMTHGESDFSRKFSPYINEVNVEAIIKELDDARRDIAGNGAAKIVLFDMAVHMILLIKQGVER